MSLIAAAAALARPIGLPPSYEDRAARALNQELESARAILAMRLDDQTRAALIAIARPHVAELNALERAKRESAASVASAMKDLRAAVLANQGVSEDVKRSVRQAEEGYKAIQERIERALPERASATWSLLSTAQGAALRRSARAGDEDEGAWLRRLIERREQREFNRARPANSAFGRPDRPGRADLRAGRMHPNRRPFESDRILEGLYRQYGLRDEEIQRALSFGRSLMKDAQPEDERLGREPFLRELLALPSKGILDPRPDAVTERRIAATLLTPHALRLLDPKSEIEAPYEMAPELDATINDIRALNLVNSLYLDQKQMEAMRAILTTAQQEYQALTARERDLAQQYLGVLRTAQASLSSGKFPPLANAEQQKALAEQRKALAETRTSLDERFLGEVRALLTPNQIDMVSNFVPCVVPVQSLTNPERVGQADNASVWEKQIARLRSVPEPRLEMAMARLAERVEETYRRKKHSEDEIEAVLARLPKVVRAARALDDAAFAVKKSELAHEIAVPDKPNAVGKALDERIVNFLLSPNLIPIYTARLSAATTAGR